MRMQRAAYLIRVVWWGDDRIIPLQDRISKDCEGGGGAMKLDKFFIVSAIQLKRAMLPLDALSQEVISSSRIELSGKIF